MPFNVTIYRPNSYIQTVLVIIVLSSTHLSDSKMMIFYPCLNHAFYPFVTLVEYTTLLTIPLLEPSTISHLFQGRLLQLSLSFSIFLAVNLIAFNLLSTVQLELFLKPLALAISHASSNLRINVTIDQRILYKVLSPPLSLSYKTLRSQKPSYHYNLLNLQYFYSLAYILLSLFNVPVTARLIITERSFTRHAPALWNSLPIKCFAISCMSHVIYQSIRLSPLLSFTPSLRLISSNNHFLLSMFTPLHRRLSCSFGLA